MGQPRRIVLTRDRVLKQYLKAEIPEELRDRFPKEPEVEDAEGMETESGSSSVKVPEANKPNTKNESLSAKKVEAGASNGSKKVESEAKAKEEARVDNTEKVSDKADKNKPSKKKKAEKPLAHIEEKRQRDRSKSPVKVSGPEPKTETGPTTQEGEKMQVIEDPNS